MIGIALAIGDNPPINAKANSIFFILLVTISGSFKGVKNFLPVLGNEVPSHVDNGSRDQQGNAQSDHPSHQNGGESTLDHLMGVIEVLVEVIEMLVEIPITE